MSTLAYAAITGKREEAAPGTSTTTSAPGTKTYVDALAALVPAEVLTAHAAILTFTSDTINKDGQKVVKITEPVTLVYAFYGLIVVSVAIYVAGRLMSSAWDRWDMVRMLIPTLSFVGWTMIQKATAFDAAFPDVSQAARGATAIIGAILLGLLAAALAYKADAKRNPRR